MIYLNPDLKLRKLGPHYMIVEACRDKANFTNVFVLNDTAAWIWESVKESGFTVESIADLICGAYPDVNHDRALADARTLVEKWQRFGMLVNH